jgi:hypothetical protein
LQIEQAFRIQRPDDRIQRERSNKMAPAQDKRDSTAMSQFGSCRDSAIVDQRRATAAPRGWRDAVTSLLIHFGGIASGVAAEVGTRCAISRLRSLDDDRLRDLGMNREDIERYVRFRRD